MAEPVPSPPGKLKRLQAQVESLINEDAVAEADERMSKPAQFVHFWILVGRMFIKNRGPVRASSLAYTTLLALVPLLAISLSVATLFLPREETERRTKLVEWIELGVAKVAPTLGLADQDGSKQRAKTANDIVGFVERTDFRKIGATAAAGLILVAIGLLRTVEATLNDIWGVTRGRSLLISIVFYWAVITLGPVVVIVAKGANYLQFLNRTGSMMQASAAGQLLLSLSFVVPLLLTSVALGALYFCMPNARVKWQAALVGGAVAASLWMANGKLSALYNTRVLTYNAIYGGLGALPLFLVGVYLTWLIVLFGAQVAYVFQYRKAYLQERLAGRVNQQSREFVALRFMTELGLRFVAGGKPATGQKLAEQLGVPPNLTKDILRTLAAAGLVHEVAGPEPAFTPGRPLATLTVRDVLQALRCGAGGELATAADCARPVVGQVVASVQTASDTEAAAITFEEIVRRAQAAASQPV